MSVPTTYSAAILPKLYGKHEIHQRSTPSLGSDEVLIKIIATAINPVDWKIRDYDYFKLKYPIILGSDAAGEVVSVGADAKDISQGDRVFFQGIIPDFESTTFQQYCKMPAALVGRTPSKTTDEEAAGISLASVAVVTGFYDKTGHGLTPPWVKGGENVGKGKAIIILGGSSSVGQYAIQFARLSGFERIITNSSPTHVEFLKSLGATTVLDRFKATIRDFKDTVGSLPIEFVMDTITTKDTQLLGVKILHEFKGGDVISVLPVDVEAVKLGKQDPEKPVELKFIEGFGSSPALRYLTEPLMKVLGGEGGWLANGKIVPNRPEVVPGGLHAADEALDRNKKGVSGVKVVIKPIESA